MHAHAHRRKIHMWRFGPSLFWTDFEIRPLDGEILNKASSHNELRMVDNPEKNKSGTKTGKPIQISQGLALA